MANQVKLYAGESCVMVEGDRVDLVNDFGVPIYMSIEEGSLYGPVTKISSLLGVLADSIALDAENNREGMALVLTEGGVLELRDQQSHVTLNGNKIALVSKECVPLKIIRKDLVFYAPLMQIARLLKFDCSYDDTEKSLTFTWHQAI